MKEAPAHASNAEELALVSPLQRGPWFSAFSFQRSQLSTLGLTSR